MPLDLSHELDRYVTALEARFGADLVSVVLFGSRARGTAGRDSDLDLLVVARGLPGSRLARQSLLFRLARTVSEEFADALMPVPLTPEEAATVKPFYLGCSRATGSSGTPAASSPACWRDSRRGCASWAPDATWTRTATSTGISSPT